MSIFEKIKALFAINSVIKEMTKEAKMPTESGAPGYKTTEFYFHVAQQIGLFWATLQGIIPPKWYALVSVIGVSVYGIGRIVAKAVADIQAAKSGSTTITTTAPVTTVTTP